MAAGKALEPCVQLEFHSTVDPFCKEGLPVTNLEAGCENKCASPYIGEPFRENSVGGKWLMRAMLRIPLTLLGRGRGRLGGEIILLNCRKCLQINRTFLGWC
jgi:hypothetical protein